MRSAWSNDLAIYLPHCDSKTPSRVTFAVVSKKTERNGPRARQRESFRSLMSLCTIRLYELTSTFSRPMLLLFGETAHFFLLSGSSKMPSFSSRLLASSRAQVCILQEKSKSALSFLSFYPTPTSISTSNSTVLSCLLPDTSLETPSHKEQTTRARERERIKKRKKGGPLTKYLA
jgi:hypothetical protein